jgi:hypothetical protein
MTMSICFCRVIASLSLGAPRTFIMTHDSRSKRGKNSKSPKCDSSASSSIHPKNSGLNRKNTSIQNFPNDELRKDRPPQILSCEVSSVTRKTWLLESGSLVVMQGETQMHWKHEIPKYVLRTKLFPPALTTITHQGTKGQGGKNQPDISPIGHLNFINDNAFYGVSATRRFPFRHSSS